MGFLSSLVAPLTGALEDVFSANQARDNATTAYNRTRELDQWLGSNQVQWRVNDLKAAGLNPVLAAGAGFGGGMSTQVAPQAQMGSSGNLPQAVNSAQMVAANVENIKADTKVKEAQAAEVMSRTYGPGQFGQSVDASIQRDISSAGAANATAAELVKRLDYLDAQIDNLGRVTEGQSISNALQDKLQDLLVGIKQVELQSGKLGLKKAGVEATSANILQDGLDALQKGTNSFGQWLGSHAADLRDALKDYAESRSRALQRH